MPIPDWLKSQKVEAQFRVGEEEWQLINITLEDDQGQYAAPDDSEKGILHYIAHGQHPHGGEVFLIHWQESHGPLAGHTGIDTLWFQKREEGIAVRGTFFLDQSTDYGEISSATTLLR
ncbi:hypothetical protein PN498_14905 [Oscillatoria sp. CS-180]|uniref:hypothetical protein n=1 Tax=Oscillatoria sp. CS-180 TaxID=3021720 RepID=UPI00232CC6ED|nr:hypothetical protein [Oscillatoria sp. CS-180]MDB9527287.1 hypothetical protein [Oscillatoria sp. CS-180]